MKNSLRRRPFRIADFWLLIVGIPVLSVILSILFFTGNVAEGWLCYTENIGSATLSTAIFWIGNRTIVFQFRKRFNAPHENGQRLLFTILTVLIFTVGTVLIMHWLETLAPEGTPNVYRDSSLGRKMGAVLFATLTVLSIYEALFYFAQWKESLHTAERLKKEHTISQLEALKNQVNPHFLFNSLNTLAALIPEDSSKAVTFVHKLSNVYRNVLELKDKKVVTLAEELECLDSYLFLVHERFGEALRVEISVSDESRHRYLVPLSLQILVENAIKHNVISRRRALTIVIETSDPGTLVVRNNFQPKPHTEDGTGTGLRNINERFRLTFGNEVDVSETSQEFIIRLPLVAINDL